MVLAMLVVAIAAAEGAAQLPNAAQSPRPEGVVIQTRAAAGLPTPRADGLPYSVTRIRQLLGGERRIYRGIEPPLSSDAAPAGPASAVAHPRMSGPAPCGSLATDPLGSQYRHIDSWQEAAVLVGFGYLESLPCPPIPGFRFNPIGWIAGKIRRGKESRARQEILAELAELGRVNKALAGASGTNPLKRQ